MLLIPYSNATGHDVLDVGNYGDMVRITRNYLSLFIVIY
jgi:hypothetical protein